MAKSLFGGAPKRVPHRFFALLLATSNRRD
jgi:hypothetical protein